MSSTPHDRFPLPPGLASLLKNQRTACTIQATDQGVALVVKLPASNIRTLHGPVRFQLRFQVYEHPVAAVILTILTMHRIQAHPVVVETYVNPDDSLQRMDFEALSKQPNLIVLFYDEKLRHRLSKRVDNVAKIAAIQALHRADAILSNIPDNERDFNTAMADIVAMKTPTASSAVDPETLGGAVDF